MHSVVSFGAMLLLVVGQPSEAGGLLRQPAGTHPSTLPVSASAEPATIGPASPGSTLQLLSNLKTLIATNALVQESTFTEGALTTILGGDQFQWIADRPALKMVNVRHFATTLSVAAAIPGYTIYAGYQSKVDDLNGPQGQIILPRLDQSVRIDELIHLFGDGYRVNDAHVGELTHPTLLAPATVPEGNKVYSYEFTDAGIRTYLAITLEGDGTVGTLSVTQRKVPVPATQ